MFSKKSEVGPNNILVLGIVTYLPLIGAHNRLLVKNSKVASIINIDNARNPDSFLAFNFGSAVHIKNAATS